MKNRYWKRVAALALSGALVIGTLAGCGSGTTASSQEQPSQAGNKETAAQAAGTEEAAEDSGVSFDSVSYTHLDVYKRQQQEESYEKDRRNEIL